MLENHIHLDAQVVLYLTCAPYIYATWGSHFKYLQTDRAQVIPVSQLINMWQTYKGDMEV